MCSNTRALCSLKDPIDFSAVIASVLISEMDLSGRWNKFGPYGLQWHMMKSHCCRWMICCIKLIIARVMLSPPAMRRKDNMRWLDERPFDGRRSWLMWLQEQVSMEVPVYGGWLGSFSIVHQLFRKSVLEICSLWYCKRPKYSSHTSTIPSHVTF